MTDDTPRLTHLDAEGRARMVDVAGKKKTERVAIAEGRIVTSPEALEAIRSGETPKGDVLQVAELAGIMAGKRTGELVPLCHLLPATSITVELEVDPELPGLRGRARASIAERTGVEMEALTAVSVALLTVYDMVKSIDRGMRIEGIRLLRKEGGRSGRWVADDEAGNPTAESGPRLPDG